MPPSVQSDPHRPAASSTWTLQGLTVQADFDEGYYPTGTKVSDAELAAVPLKPHDFHPGEVGGWLAVG